jgi:hypothetical protein
MASIDDLITLGYTVSEAYTGVDRVCVVEGFGIRTYVADTDQETIDQLLALPAHVERVFQSDYPDADAARSDLTADGFTVTRPDPDQNVFTVEKGSEVTEDVTPETMPDIASGLLGGG